MEMSEMYRRGHTGIALLAYAPVGYILLRDGQPALALGGLLGVLCVEPLPDNDFWFPGLRHGGISHSLLCALVVGSVLGAGGWLLGTGLNGLLARPIVTLVSLPMQVDDSIVGELIGLFRHLDREVLAGFGFAVGVFGVLIHLVGDVITVSGIRPFLPVSSRRISLSPLRADSTVANSVLLALGVIAIVGVLVVSTSAGAVVIPQPCPFSTDTVQTPPRDECIPSFDLSPVGVASAQNSGTHNASVIINKTELNRTQIELAHVTLPQNGYIVARSGNLSANTSSGQGKILGRTQYVRHGSYSGVVLNLSEPVNTSQTVSVTIHDDANGNKTWDGAKTDTAYHTSNDAPILDTIRFGSGQQSTTNTNANATVEFANQTANGSTVTIKRATLPEGGFVVLSNDPYEEVGTLSESMIAVSKPLSPGTHRNISIEVTNSPPGGVVNQTVLNTTSDYSVGLYRDSNNNSRFEYITSAGTNDTAYLVGSGTERRYASDAADVTIPGSSTSIPTASIQFTDHRTNGSAVMINSIRVPEGGFAVIHNESYRRGGDPLTSAVGVSTYLKPGRHTNVTVPLLQEAVTSNQTLVAVPYRDTNDNQRYDYIASDGFRDPAYVNRTGKQGIIVNDTAAVTVASTARPSTETATSTPTATTTPVDTATPFRVTNLSVSNRTVHVGDEVTVTAWIENPGKTRLDGKLALATAGTAVETQQVALFPSERRAVTFTQFYDAPGEYVVKVANHTKRVRVAPEGAPLTPLTMTATTDSGANNSNTKTASTQSQSDGSLSLTDIVLLGVLLIVLGGLVWLLYRLRKRI